jgi:hypothetical protein
MATRTRSAASVLEAAAAAAASQLFLAVAAAESQLLLADSAAETVAYVASTATSLASVADVAAADADAAAAADAAARTECPGVQHGLSPYQLTQLVQHGLSPYQLTQLPSASKLPPCRWFSESVCRKYHRNICSVTQVSTLPSQNIGKYLGGGVGTC